MDDLDLLVDLHREGSRQGPGGDAETRLALALSCLTESKGLEVADIGCGTGASTFVLADELDATITAVDFLPPFLEELRIRAKGNGIDDRIKTVSASMDALPFKNRSLDAIWSEGAIYNIGFTNGVETWREFLKPNGVLAVSDLTWRTHRRPAELEAHWQREYPGVDTASAKMAVLEECGYSTIGYFPLPPHCWLDNYYRPLQSRFAGFLRRHGNSEAARAVVAAEEAEIVLYEQYADFFSYGFFIARRTPD